MTQTETARWADLNQRYLSAALDLLRLRLEGQGGDASSDAALPVMAEAMPAPPAILTLQRAFGLSDFERDVLLLCAGPELDAAFARACEIPTFSLALATLDAPHWSALSPAAPLRRWRLVQIVEGRGLVASPLRIDERVLHYLAGVQYLDEHLARVVRMLDPGTDLPPSHQKVADTVAQAWISGGDDLLPPLIELGTRDWGIAEAVAGVATRALGLQLAVLRAADIPAVAGERDELIRLWEREAVLGAFALLVDARDIETTVDMWPVADFLDRVASPVLALASRRVEVRGRRAIRVPLAPLELHEVGALWRRELAAREIDLNGQLGRVTDQFSFNSADIRAVSSDLRARLDTGAPDDTAGALWELCRHRARPGMDGLAQPIDTVAGWDDLVLLPGQKQILRDIAAQVRQRGRVYHDWGFAGVSRRGLGTSALFAGPSGTGKTMAAEVLAGELRLDLYRIDLSQVVSKYIGETEKNLARLFDAADGGGVILLFDEADALFGKRSEVRDSHDRYANIEVSYLLQRMESYRGLAILTTNLKGAIDTAFLRRLRFVVQFPFPDVAARAAIWQCAFPPETPREGLDTDKLARLSVAGGSIRNIALNAAFLAAEEDHPVEMRHVLQAARAEATKLERPLSDAEIRGWV